LWESRLKGFRRIFEIPIPKYLGKKIAGMRDVISHDYEDLAYEVLWDALEFNFPDILSDFKKILSEL
jgi:uncharacterized protein with HEPN domain